MQDRLARGHFQDIFSAATGECERNNRHEVPLQPYHINNNYCGVQ